MHEYEQCRGEAKTAAGTASDSVIQGCKGTWCGVLTHTVRPSRLCGTTACAAYDTHV